MKRILSVFLMACFVSASQAGTIDLSALYNGGAPFIGDTVMFSDIIESNGAPTDPAIHFMQNPLTFGDRIDFNPTGFRAEVAPGPGFESYDTEVTMTISAEPGYVITGLCFHEEGDYQVLGDGTVEAVLDVAWQGGSASGSASSSFFSSPDTTGLWNIDLSIPVAGSPSTLDLTFSNSLTAEAGDNLSLGFIAKKSFNGLLVKTEMVPEPTSALVGLMGAMMMMIFWRRS